MKKFFFCWIWLVFLLSLRFPRSRLPTIFTCLSLPTLASIFLANFNAWSISTYKFMAFNFYGCYSLRYSRILSLIVCCCFVQSLLRVYSIYPYFSITKYNFDVTSKCSRIKPKPILYFYVYLLTYEIVLYRTVINRSSDSHFKAHGEELLLNILFPLWIL